jgi:hypothetical protein
LPIGRIPAAGVSATVVIKSAGSPSGNRGYAVLIRGGIVAVKPGATLIVIKRHGIVGLLGSGATLFSRSDSSRPLRTSNVDFPKVRLEFH